MVAVRRANNRFSTLRSRIMRRSASGSQAGGDDMLRASRELSTVSVSGSIFDLLNSDDRASWKAKASSWLEGIYATIAITVVVFFALFLDDFRLAVLPTSLDVSCEYISGLILVLFSVELTVACLVRKGYFASIYFWIDLAATISMLLDITALMDLVFQQRNSLAGTSALDRGPQNKVLVRMRQILRVTRIFRLMRLVRLYLQYLVSHPPALGKEEK
ncbi:g7275 [Coccomyxa elongata]